MWEITADNAAEYLRATGRIAPDDRVAVRELTGGVSNVVLYVQHRAANAANAVACERAFVVKQARPRLRVAQPWFCSVERSWRELAVLRACEAILSRSAIVPATTQPLVAVTPAVLWEDRDHYAFAMSAAPADHIVWKQCLLDPAGNARFARGNLRIAAACGRLLGRLHAASWNDAALREALGDTSLFDALRVDPYYRRIAAVHPDLQPPVDRLIASLAENPRALVHADFSPKNLLVWGDGDVDGDGDGGTLGLMMVDFETGHFGDPAFDLGFFLTHLALKAIHHAPQHEPLLALADEFWNAYLETLRDDGLANGDASDVAGEIPALAARAMRHLGGCVLARIDGKSPVDYLEAAAARDAARAFGRSLLVDPAEAWPEARRRLIEQLAARQPTSPPRDAM